VYREKGGREKKICIFWRDKNFFEWGGGLDQNIEPLQKLETQFRDRTGFFL
jgi:hypothetical protein